MGTGHPQRKSWQSKLVWHPLPSMRQAEITADTAPSKNEVVTAFKKVFHFLVQSVGRTPSTETCQLCGNVVSKNCAVFLSSSERSSATEAKGKNHPPNSLKKARQGEHLKSCRLNPKRKSTPKNNYLNGVCRTEPSTPSVTSSDKDLLSSAHSRLRKPPVERESSESSCSSKCSSQIHAHNSPRDTANNSPSNKKLKELLCASGKTSQTDSLHFVAPESARSASSGYKSSDTSSLSNSVCSISKVYYESGHTDLSNAPVSLQQHASDQISSCSDVEDLPSCHSEGMTHYSQRSTTHSLSSSPSERPSLRAIGQSDSDIDVSISSVSDDDVHGICTPSASQSLPPNDAESSCVKGGQLSPASYPSSLASSSQHDSLTVFPIGCLLQEAQAAKLAALMRRRALYPVHGLPAPIAKSQESATLKECQANGNKGQPTIGILSASQSCNNVLTSSNEESGQSFMNVPEMGTPCTCSTTMQRLETHLNRKSLQNIWGMPTTIQKSHILYTPPAPTTIESRAIKKTFKTVPVALETLPFLRENTRQGLDSHLSKLASGRRMGLPSKIQESIRKCIPSAPCASQSASRSDREKAPLLLKSGQPSNMPRDCGAGEANPKGFKQMSQDSSVPKVPPACITSYAGSPEYWKSQLGSHPSIVGHDLQKCSIIANESTSRETAFPVPNQLNPELTCKAQPHLKPRAQFAPHLSTSKTDCLERNIKHKKLAFLWSLSDSLATFKPKVTGLPAFTQSCAAPIKRLPFMKPNLRGTLVWPPEELHGDSMLSCPARKHPQWTQKPVIKVSTTKDTTLISRNARNILKSRFKIGIANQKSEFLRNAPTSIRRHFPRNWPETELLSDTSEKKFPCHSIANSTTQTPKTPYHCKEIEYSDRSEIGALHKQQPIDRSPPGLNGWKTHQGGFDETGLEAQASQGKRLRDNESSSPESCLPKRAFKGQRFMRQRITSILGQAATDNLEHNLMQKQCVAFGEFLAHSAQAWSPKALRPVQTTASGSSIMLREKELPFVESKPGGSQQGHVQRKSPVPDERMAITLRKSVIALPPADIGPLKQDMKESFFHKGQSSVTLLHKTTSSTDSTESLVIHVGNGSSDTKVESVSSEDSGQMVTEDTELPLPNVASRRSQCLLRTNLGDVGYVQRDITHTDMKGSWRPPPNSMPVLYKMAAKETSLPPELKSVEAIVESSETDANTRQVLEAFDNLRKIPENKKLQTTNPQQSSRTFTPPTTLQSPLRECLNKESEVHINQADICFLSKHTKNLLEEHIANQIFQKNLRPSSNMLDASVNVMPPAPDISKSSLSLSPLDSLSRKCTSQASMVSSSIDMPYTDTPGSEDDIGLSLPHKDESMAVCSRRLAHESTDLVRPCYETLKFILKNVRLKLNHFGKRPLQSRTTFLPFADHIGIDAVEWNLKQKHLKCLLGIPPAPQGEFQEIMAKASILQPPTPQRTANVQFSEMDIDFLNPNERALLEQHILRMMMDYEWGLPSLLQRSPQECMAKAPQLERMKTCPQTDVEIVLVREEAAFVPKTTRKDLELHTKKRMLHHDVGLPTRVVESFAQFFPPAPLSKVLLSDEATEVNISECTISTTSPKQSKEYGTCAQFVAHSRNNMSIIVSSYKGASTQTSPVDGTKLNKQQTKKCLETQMVPMASKSPVFCRQEKGCLPQFRATWLKPRVSLSTVIDPVSVPGLDLNQRHKLLAHLWGLPPMHLCSPWKPKPKESLLVPRGTLKEFSEMVTSFLKPRVRDYLDCHIKRKMLQHEWSVPAFLQFSLHAFIPAAPMPAQPRTPLAVAIKLVIIRREAFFLNEDTRNHLETHVKQRIKPDTLGVPHKVLKALTAFHHVPPRFHAQVCRTEEENISGLYFALSGQANSGKNIEYIPEPLRIPQTRKRVVLAALDQLLSLDQNTLRRHLRKKCLEMRMEMLSSPVKNSMKVIYFLMKQTLPKSDKGGNLFVHSRSRCIPFLKIDSLCSLEKNIQHKHLMFLWGMPTLQKESVSRMVPSPFPLPHTHKGSENGIVFGERDTPFLRPDTRERLEWHMERKNLHQQCNLPQLIKKSLLAYLPPAPKLQKPLMRINQKLNILVIKGDLFFMSESNQHNLEKHIKKKIDQKKTGLPQRIVEFFKSIISCKPPRSDVVLHCYGVYPIPGCPSSSIKIIEDPRFTGCKELVTYASDLRETMSSQELKLGLQRCNDLHLQLIKKCCEARLGTIHPTVIQSWTVPGSNPNPSLYKTIEMAERCVAKRRLRMHFVGQDRISSIERNIRQKQLMFLLGNPIAHTVYLFEMMPHTHPLPPQIQGSRAAIEFSDAETLFVEAAFRQCLERHIKVKRVQHVCGLPALFQASKKAFTPQGPICGLPQPATKCKGNREAIALRKEACFLGTFERKHLEIHIKKMVLQNTFGLPLKILDALKSFTPIAPVDVMHHSQAEGDETTEKKPKSHRVAEHRKECTPSPGHTGYMEHTDENTVQGLCPHDVAHLQKIQLLIQRKCLEVKTGTIPLIVKMSLATLQTMQKEPLPKLDLVCKSLAPRVCLPVFVEHGDLKLIELNLRHKYLASQWGLPSLHRDSGVSLGTNISALPPGDLEILARKKRLQQELDLSIKTHNTAQCVMPHPPAPSGPKKDEKPEVDVVVQREKQLFISRLTQHHLDSHIERVRMQQRSGLYAKILASLKQAMPSTPEVTEIGHSSGPMQVLMDEEWSGTGGAVERGVSDPRDQRDRPIIPQPFLRSTLCTEICLSQVCMAKQHLEIYLELLPSCVMKSWKLVNPVPIDLLPKIICSDQICNKTRTTFIRFMEHNTVKRLSMNLAQKHFMFLWGQSTAYAGSLMTAIPQASALLPLKGGRQAIIEFADMPTHFMLGDERDAIDWHVHWKRLQDEWMPPALIQRSLASFAPAPPELTAPKPKSAIEVTIQSAELTFIDDNIKRHLESSMKSHISPHACCLSRQRQIILSKFKSPTGLKDQLSSPSRNEGPMFVLAKKRNTNGCRYQSTWKDGKDIHSIRRGLGKILQRGLPEDHALAFLSVEVKRKLQFHLVRKSIELRLGVIGPLVKSSHEWAILDKTIPIRKSACPGGWVMAHGSASMEPLIINGLDMIIEQKDLVFLLGLPSWHTRYLSTIIPKCSSLGAWSKPGRVAIDFSPMDTPFLLCELRQHLEWHIKTKRLQQECHVPPEVQQSLELFSPLTQELFGSGHQRELHLNFLPPTTVLKFIHEDTQERMDFHIQKLTLQKRFGLSKQIEHSLKQCVLPFSIQAGQYAEGKAKASVHLATKDSRSLQATALSAGAQEIQQSAKPACSDRGTLWSKELEKHLARKGLEVKMGVLPLLAEWSSGIASTDEKTQLPKPDLPKLNCKQRLAILPFLKKELIHQLELNITHKHFMSLWGMVTQCPGYLKSMTPAASALVTPFQTNTLSVEFSEMETPFMDSKDREALEWLIKKKKFHQDLGMPNKIQRSSGGFVEHAPKLAQSKTRHRDLIDIFINRVRLPFLSKYAKEMLESHIKRVKTLQRKCGVETTQHALNALVDPTLRRNMQTSKYKSNGNSQPQPALKLCFKKYAKLKPPIQHSRLSPEHKRQHPKLIAGRPVPRHASQKGNPGPTGKWQQLMENLSASPKVSSMSNSNMLSQTCHVHRYRYMTWKNRDRKVLPTIAGTNPGHFIKPQFVTPTRSEAEIIGRIEGTTLTMAVDSRCKDPLPDSNETENIAMAVELHPSQGLEHSGPPHQSTPRDEPMTFPAPPSFPEEIEHLNAMTLHTAVANFQTPQDSLELISVFNLHLRKKSLEPDFSIPNSVHESSDLTGPQQGPPLSTLTPSLDINTMLANADITDLPSSTKHVSASGILCEPCIYENTINTSKVCRKEIIQDLEDKFMSHIFRRFFTSTLGNNPDPLTDFPFQSSPCTCSNQDYDILAKQTWDPASCVAFNLLIGRTVDRLEVSMQSICDLKDGTELPIQSENQSLGMEVMLSSHKLLSPNISSQVGSPLGSSLWVPIIRGSVFHRSQDIKRNLGDHVQHKMIMNILGLPLCVIESRQIHHDTLTRKKREEIRRIRTMGARQGITTEMTRHTHDGTRLALLNSNDCLLRKSLEENQKILQDSQSSSQLFHSESLKSILTNQRSSNGDSNQEYHAFGTRLREPKKKMQTMTRNIASQTPRSWNLAPGSSLPMNTSRSTDESTEGTAGDGTLSPFQSSQNEESPAALKQLKRGTSNHSVNTSSQRSTQTTTVDYNASLKHKTTFLQKLKSNFKRHLFSWQGKKQAKPSLNGVKGHRPSRHMLLHLKKSSATSQSPKKEAQRPAKIPWKISEILKTITTKTKKVDLPRQALMPVNPALIIPSQSSTGSDSSQKQWRSDDVGYQAGREFQQYLVMKPKENQEKRKLSKAMAKAKKVPSTTTGKEDPCNARHTSEKVISMCARELEEIWKTQCQVNASGNSPCSSWQNRLLNTRPTVATRSNLTEENEMFSDGAWRGKERVYQADCIKSDGSHYSRRARMPENQEDKWARGDASVADNYCIREKRQGQHETPPSGFFPSSKGSTSQDRTPCQDSKLEDHDGAKDAGRELCEDSTSANSTEGASRKNKYIFLEYSL